jgi:hypothetical protein
MATPTSDESSASFPPPLLVVSLDDILIVDGHIDVVDGRIDVDVDVEDVKYVLCTNLHR